MASALKCETCTLRFDKPMLLPCGFTSCLRCLRRLAAEHHEYIMCPDCLKRHEVPDGSGVESFPVNKLIVDLLEKKVVVDSETAPPRRSAPAPPVKTREIEICSKCENKTASFERCAHCQAVFCIFCFEKHIESITEEVENYVGAVEDHCTAAAQVVSFYTSFSSGSNTMVEHEKRKEAIIEWGEQLKSRLVRAVGARVGQLCSEVDTLIDEQSAKMTSLDDAATKVGEINEKCQQIAEDLRSSARPNVPEIFSACSQVDGEIRSLEKLLEGLGMPYMDSEAVASETKEILESIKTVGKLVCDSQRTIQDILATQDSSHDEDDFGPTTEAGPPVDPTTFYENLSTPAYATARDAQNNYFGAVWDCCALSANDSNKLLVVHNKEFATLIDASDGTAMATFHLEAPESLPDLRVDIKHVAASVLRKKIYFSQNDYNGVFSMSWPSDPTSAAVIDAQLTLVIKGSGDTKFYGFAVDDRSNTMYVCDHFRSRITAWSLETNLQVATFPISGSSINGDFKPFKCVLSMVRSAGALLLAVSDYTNERICVLALSNPTTGSVLPGVIINRGNGLGMVSRPCGMAFDAAGQLLVAEGPTRRVQVFKVTPECTPVMAFPANNDKLRSPRGMSVFYNGPQVGRQTVAIADNAANSVFFYKNP